MRISDWSSDVCSSDLLNVEEDVAPIKTFIADTNCIIMRRHGFTVLGRTVSECYHRTNVLVSEVKRNIIVETLSGLHKTSPEYLSRQDMEWMFARGDSVVYPSRSEEHTSELQSLMRSSYAVFCLKKKKNP